MHIYSFDIAKLTSLEVVPICTPQVIYERAQVLIFNSFPR